MTEVQEGNYRELRAAPASERRIAYFSMEIALEPEMPTYAGGLGVLAGDMVRAAADLKVPMVAVSLLCRRGHFRQRLDAEGRQREEPVEWVVEDFLAELPESVEMSIEGRPVRVRAWRYEVRGIGGFTVPVYFLDTDLPQNSAFDRGLTGELYGGDLHYRLCQEAVLGIGGVRALRAAGHDGLRRFHMNEGHASLLTLELLDERARKAGRTAILPADVEAVRGQCVFTTHTPVPSGHDRFPLDLAQRVLGRRDIADMKDVFCCADALNLTFLALNLSDFVNGVARRHAEVSQLMFSPYRIDAITNGVHAPTWTSEPFQALFDRRIPGWREDNFSLRYALGIPREEVWEAHAAAKRRLVAFVNRMTNAGMDRDVLTIGFARRATAYKRPELLFEDPARLRRIAAGAGAIQLVFAGKAHPQDHAGKELIRRIFQAREALRPEVKVAYLENYDLEIAGLMTAGSDVWLNTPLPPLEASGTSGMKAALNGVPSLSVLDGWWIEGCIEGITGWAIGELAPRDGAAHDPARDAAALYEKLEGTVIPLFYGRRDGFVDVMRHAIALNGSFFSAERMVEEYVVKAWFR